MESKKDKPLSRRGFLSNTGKTLFFATVSASAIPAFLSSCKKVELVDNSGNTKNVSLLILEDNVYHCNNGDGFICDQDGGFSCPDNNFHCHDLFECHDYFACDETNNFQCLGQGAYTMHLGGQGG